MEAAEEREAVLLVRSPCSPYPGVMNHDSLRNRLLAIVILVAVWTPPPVGADTTSGNRYAYQDEPAFGSSLTQKDLRASEGFWASLTATERETALKVELLSIDFYLRYHQVIDPAKSSKEVAQNIGRPEQSAVVERLLNRYMVSTLVYKSPLYTVLSPERQRIIDYAVDQVCAYANLSGRLIESDAANARALMDRMKSASSDEFLVFVIGIDLADDTLISRVYETDPDFDFDSLVWGSFSDLPPSNTP